MTSLKAQSFFGGICLESIFILVIATFALCLSMASPVYAQCTHTVFYTFTGEAESCQFGTSVSGEQVM
jgi:hypothetical protein